MSQPQTCYRFDRRVPLISRPADMPPPGPYYTSLVAMDGVEGFPFDYALFCSTDHHHGQGGIWLFLCNGAPTDAANWVAYDQAVADGAFDHLADKPAGNPILLDTVQGRGHTETPHAQVIDGVVHLAYHKNAVGPNQATILATSTDGVNYSRLHGQDDSVILRYDPAVDPGNGHTGYFRWGPNPFDGVDARYIGYSLHGGGDQYHSAMWASDDARRWRRRGVFEPIEGLAVDHKDRMVIWHEIDPASIRRLPTGEYVAIACVGNRASGSVARVNELYEIYLAADGMTFTRVSQPLLNCGDGNAPDAEELGSPTLVTIGGAVHLIYVGAAQGGSVNTIMGAVGRLSLDKPDAPRLSAEHGQRHNVQRA